jgi:hypothetical protein
MCEPTGVSGSMDLMVCSVGPPGGPMDPGAWDPWIPGHQVDPWIRAHQVMSGSTYPGACMAYHAGDPGANVCGGSPSHEWVHGSGGCSVVWPTMLWVDPWTPGARMVYHTHTPPHGPGGVRVDPSHPGAMDPGLTGVWVRSMDPRACSVGSAH